MLHLYFYSLPGPAWFPSPVAQLFYLAPDCADPLPGKQIVLYYGNYCFQLAMPFGPADTARLLGKTVQLPRFPLLLNQEKLRQFGDYQEVSADFTSAARRKEEPHEIICSFTEYIQMDSDESEEDTLRKYGYWPLNEVS
ncbi:MAG: hypothetical protein EOO61_11295 [Hymenobacter sp.]|nr:MAG: hypothetical protein EOO61_11295 [Hymenobacter sp.]